MTEFTTDASARVVDRNVLNNNSELAHHGQNGHQIARTGDVVKFVTLSQASTAQVWQTPSVNWEVPTNFAGELGSCQLVLALPPAGVPPQPGTCGQDLGQVQPKPA